MEIQEGDITPNILVGDEPFACMITTRHADGITAWTAVHGDRFPIHIGGIRLVAHGTRAEVGHLSSAMTLKCGAASLPACGQKTVIDCNGAVPETVETRAALISEHVGFAVQRRAGLIFGPDMGIAEPEIDRLATTHGFSDHVAGCSRAAGGLSIDERGYTAHGLAIATGLVRAGLPLRSVIIQGFGAVGMHFARRAAAQGLIVRAVSNIQGTLVDLSARGLDVEALVALHQRHQDGCLARYARSRSTARFEANDRLALFDVQADIFVPAARVSVLATGDELAAVRASVNPEAVDVEHFWRLSGVKLIVQGANHPITSAAERALEAHGVLVLPDYLVNLGGLVGCFVGWLYRHELCDGLAQVDEVHAIAQGLIRRAITDNVTALLESRMPARQAAQAIVRERIEATQRRFAAEVKRPDRPAIRRFLGLPGVGRPTALSSMPSR